MSDLPPRSWRRWWLERPKWLRIGCRTALWGMMFNLILAARIVIGLSEHQEIALLRERGVKLTYCWEERPEHFRHQYFFLAGLYGRSWASLSEIRLDGRTTDENLEQIVQRCWRLKRLSLRDAEVPTASLAKLARCRSLERLDLANTDADDELIAQLAKLPNLTHLEISGTLASDQSLEVLKSVPGLRRVNFSYTDVSAAGFSRWQQEVPRSPPVIESELSSSPQRLLVTISWSNGQRSSSFRRGYSLAFFESGDPSLPRAEQAGQILDRASFNNVHRKALHIADGDYVAIMKLGAFVSSPVALQVTDGVFSPEVIEFQMPCTKVEALGQ